MQNWEAILEEYMDGSGSRAAAESLRFRIALSTEARREVETVLRLADRLADAVRSVQPPAGAAGRLGDRIRFQGPPEFPANWARDGAEFVSPAACGSDADEEAVNAAIEGEPETTDAPPAPLSIGRASATGQDLNEFNSISAALRGNDSPASDELVPPGAVDRLRSKFEEAIEAGEGGASPLVARRILSQIRGEASGPLPFIRPPDVRAAGEEPEE